MDHGIFVHQNALIEPGAQIGRGTRVWAFAHILPGARIGADCNICDHVFIENDVVIGDRVTVKCGIYIWDGVQIKDDVHLGPNVVFTNVMKPRSRRYPDAFARTVVKEWASIGANATLLPGISIGRWAMIGAGTVVTRDVPDFAVIVGNPGRHIGYICVCDERLHPLNEHLSFHCSSCGREYRWNKQGLQLQQDTPYATG
jgi:UDP-2-acetamido-3-amino-2,3-dideoxy-glucuronate N-acetyltransferase